MMQVLVLMRTDVVSDSVVFVFNSPRIGPVPTNATQLAEAFKILSSY